MIKFEALRTFITVAKAGNIALASEQLGRTPSAISMTLKALEESIGGPLFETERKNTLSRLGEYTFDIASEQVNSFDNALRKIDDFAHSRSGSIAISCVPSVAIHIVPEVLPNFTEKRPKVEIELYDMDGSSVCTAIRNEKAQIGIAGQPSKQWALNFEPLFEDSFVVIFNPEHFDIAPNKAMTWEALSAYPMILNGAANMIESEQFKELAKNATLTVRNLNSLMALLNTGIGITILPALTALDLPDHLAIAPLSEHSAKRVVGMITPSARSQDPLVRSFRESLLDVMPSIADRLSTIDLIK